MKPFCWIVVAFSLLNYGYGFFMGKQLDASPDVQQLIQQKRDLDLQTDLLADKVAPFTATISNLVQNIGVIDKKQEALAAEADALSLTHDKLQAEIDSKESLPSMISMGSRSIFDGITVGAFADKGPMTVSINFQNWLEDVSKNNAEGKRRALQIERDWNNLDLDRSNRVSELKPIVEQQNELLKPYNTGLKDKIFETDYKLHPYVEAANRYDHQRTWSSIVFWPALLLALVIRKPTTTPPSLNEPGKKIETSENQLITSLLSIGMICSFFVWMWYLKYSSLPNAQQRANIWVQILMLSAGSYYCSKGWHIIWNKSERAAHPFQAVFYIFIFASLVFMLVVGLLGMLVKNLD